MDDGEKNVVAAAVKVVQRRWPTSPSVAMVLGTGLGRLSEQVSVDAAIGYAEIPGFLPTTAVGHRGQLICGSLSDVPVMVLDGRCHLYEGYTAQQVAFPVRVLFDCGATTLVVTNASGGNEPESCLRRRGCDRGPHQSHGPAMERSARFGDECPPSASNSHAL